MLYAEHQTYSKKQLEATLGLLEEGNTIPFIARYRKEMTGSLNEVDIKWIQDRYQYLQNLETRKEEVTRLIDEQGKLTDELAKNIQSALKLQELEDLYRPYRQKRRTKAVIAKEKGLEPFALYLMTFPTGNLDAEAEQYINLEHELDTLELVYQGTHEILAETFGDEPKFRNWIRMQTFRHGTMKTALKKDALDEKRVYEMYYEFQEAISKIANHRVLAINRAEKESVIKVDIEVDETDIFSYLQREILGKASNTSAQTLIEAAYIDAYRRFIKPAIERELRNELTEKAEAQAILVFGENLRNLLLQSPIKNKVIMGFDPAYRTGCKLAIVDDIGKVLKIQVIYPHPPASNHRQQEAKAQFKSLIERYQVDMVAIGNGTASRESEVFVANCLKELERTVYYVIVNEAGASVYSASDAARNEFPELEVEERSAISIARRVQDPLAELVKIDPKSVGVGQYQHDVTQKLLEEQLKFVVETAVNQVGVNVNTASPQLLEYVAGLNKTIAQNIVTYREQNGAFSSRDVLKKVPRLGPKAYEQATGFLRIPDSKNVFDNTSIHPESYNIAYQVLSSFGIKQEDLGTTHAKEALNMSVESSLDVGKETLRDIVDALKAPGRDFRESMPAPILRSDILSLEDLKPGMELQGTVRNVVDFGVFVDIGVKQDGLVHISKMSQSYVKHPSDIAAVGDIVKVWVVDVDAMKHRIQLSMLKE